MANVIKIGTTSDVSSGNMKTFVISGKHIALANVDGKYFAIDDICTHSRCSLGNDGMLDGTVVTCGCHGAQFDVTSGKVLALPAPSDVKSYQVKVEGDSILVLL